MAIAEQAPAKKAGPSIVTQIGVLLVMTVAVVGIGWFSGSYLTNSVPHGTTTETGTAGGHDAAGRNGEAKEGGDEDGEAAFANPLVIQLPPITTNLAAPSDTWLRLEVSIELDAPTKDPTLADTIHQDLLAFMRTVKMHQIEGASGFQHLKADLTERASIRSDGHVKAILIRTLLFE